MDIENIIKECTPRIKGMMRAKKIYGSPDEYFNDAYLKIFESGMELTVEGILRATRDLLLVNKRIECGESKQMLKFCPSCKEEFPIACFQRFLCNTRKIYVIKTLCKKCEQEKNKKYTKHSWQKGIKMLSDFYIKALLKKRGIEKITQNIIDQTRNQIHQKRIRRDGHKLKS